MRSLTENTKHNLLHRSAVDQYASHDILQRLGEEDSSTLSVQLPRLEGYPLSQESSNYSVLRSQVY